MARKNFENFDPSRNVAIGRRAFIVAGAASVVAGCAVSHGPSLIPEASAEDMWVERVVVKTDQLKGVRGRDFKPSNERIAADLTRYLNRRLKTTGRSSAYDRVYQGRGGFPPVGVPAPKSPRAVASRPVVLEVSLRRLYLVSPGQSILVGGLSQAEGVVRVLDARSGKVVVPPTEIAKTAAGYAPGGLLGAATRGSAEQDYMKTLATFANMIEHRLFGV